MNALREFRSDFRDRPVPARHFMKSLEFPGIRCNALIFTNMSALPGIPRNAYAFYVMTISPDAYEIYFKRVALGLSTIRSYEII